MMCRCAGRFVNGQPEIIRGSIRGALSVNTFYFSATLVPKYKPSSGTTRTSLLCTCSPLPLHE